MRLIPSRRRSGRPRLLVAALAILGLTAVPSAAVAASPTGEIPGHVLATFTGGIKGFVMLSDLGDGDLRVRITLKGLPSGPHRLVGSSAPCATPLRSAERLFSLTYQKIEWVRTVASRLMEDEGIFYLRSLRLVRPGSPAKQLACRAARPYRDASAPAASAVTFENTLISSYSVMAGPRGMVVTAPAEPGGIRIRALFQRLTPGVSYRLVGSGKACRTRHARADTVFDQALPAGNFLDEYIEDGFESATVRSVRLFRGAGFTRPEGCSTLHDYVELV